LAAWCTNMAVLASIPTHKHGQKWPLRRLKVKVKVSVVEHSDTIKCKNDQQTEECQLSLRASLCPQLALWLGGLAWMGW
jgi:hypothetical protein